MLDGVERWLGNRSDSALWLLYGGVLVVAATIGGVLANLIAPVRRRG